MAWLYVCIDSAEREVVVRCEMQEWSVCVLNLDWRGRGAWRESGYHVYTYSTALYFGEERNEAVLGDHLVPYRQQFILWQIISTV